MFFAPQRRAFFRHRNFKKCSETLSFLTFLLGNVLLAAAACNFSTSELQKVVWECQFFSILTSKYTSRHSGVQFFNIWTSKSASNLTCFVHFDLNMCFSSQRRASFRHLNFKKCSEPDVFCTFWLENVLLATTACNFWFLLWPHDSAPAALTSLFFDSPDTQNIGKTQHFATSLTFGAGESSFFWLSRYCIFFLLTLLQLLTLLSSDFTSAICFSSAFQLSISSEVYYLNFLRLFKLPSTTLYYSVLQSTTPLLLCTTQYYSVLLQYYSVLQSTTQYYSVIQSTTPVLLCTTKYYTILLCTTKYYTVLLQYYSVLLSTTPVLLCTTQYYSSIPVLLCNPRMVREWSATRLATEVTFRARHDNFYWKKNIPRSGYCSKFHDMLHLPGKVTLELRRILRLPRN